METRADPLIDRLTGSLLFAITALVIGSEWLGEAGFGHAAAFVALVTLGLLATQVRPSRQVFVGVGLALAAAVVVSRTGALDHIDTALQKAAFIAAFFTALTCLRHTADTSVSIRACGQFLAQQPPGRRYAALTSGGHLFALILSYGGIALLGSLAMASAKAETNIEIRNHRIRRMLLAIQRGFVSTLAWSPLAFAMAISTALIPGATWAGALLPCLVSSVILIGIGWALDTIFKPRLSTPAPMRGKPDGNWALMLPLVALLAILVISVGGLHIATGVRAVGVVMAVVPLIAVVWLAIQAPGRRLAQIRDRAATYMTHDLPGYRGELVLLMMAGVIGTLGSVLLAPVIAASGLDLSIVPGWVVLLALLWMIPVAGQIGANPILAVSLIAPVLPEASAWGLEPSDLIVAITAGWALSGASSPYTASTLLVSTFANVPARYVGLHWNGLFVLLSGLALSGWVLVVAAS